MYMYGTLKIMTGLNLFWKNILDFYESTYYLWNFYSDKVVDKIRENTEG